MNPLATGLAYCVQAFVGMAVVLLAFDLWRAIGTHCDMPAFDPASGFCDLWGGTEGPSGNAWNYQTQGYYIFAGTIRIALCAIAAFAPLFLRSSPRKFAVIILPLAVLMTWEAFARYVFV